MSVPARLKSHGESGENLSQPPRPPPRPPVSNMAPRSRRTYHSADPFNQLLNHRSTTDRAEIRAIEKDEDEDGFDTDSEEMSLAVVMKLSNDMTLLKNYLKIYQKFNQRIGGHTSGKRHKGFIRLIINTINASHQQAAKLRALRTYKQRGTVEPGQCERVAIDIYTFVNRNTWRLYDMLNEKVDIENETIRSNWVRRKELILNDFMGKISDHLGRLDGEGVDRDEVRAMEQAWVKKWETWASLNKKKLKQIGLLLGSDEAVAA
ncbi:hypothetical protein MMC21_003162 [Puttea exsequens]|nr:hypothetical protein [Puttea exsequens]